MSGLVLPDSAAARATGCGACRIAPSAMRNVGPILAQLEAHAPKRGRALELASGTGQQVVRFAARRPGLVWQPTDLNPANLDSIEAWRMAAEMAHIRPARQLDAAQPGWGAELGPFDLIVEVNMLHLVSTTAARTILAEIGAALAPGGRALLYGPFLRGGQATSPGDARFHASLQAQAPDLGYKDVAWVEAELKKAGLKMVCRMEMPANNLMLVAEQPR
ncbi:DUF938 domain-containing protein [Acidimangrovimonas pyrenivorans]|uniref:DUF938 domain-containing protein n=1 Tax=Acidimangrovimonas pyrenivorans TaxID=2030798 RepID=A0ABV7AL61_9RHOB